METISRPPKPAPPPGPVRLLSLDGGGVKGISSMMILDKIMERVRVLDGDQGPRDSNKHFPHNYFDLAGGTSTGGLATLMMFRLELSTKKTMDHYNTMSQQIFRPKVGWLDLHSWRKIGYWIGNGWLKVKKFFGGSGYDEAPLVKAINDVVVMTKIKEGGKAHLLDDTTTRMFMCSTLVERGETILFRSYTPPDDGNPLSQRVKAADFNDVSIEDAARATSAAPTYLPEMKIKDLRFWDGGLLNNNPIDQIWDARFDLAQSEKETPVVSCVVSIGTSWSSKKIGSGFFNTISQVASFATNTEAKHRDFERKIIRMNARLNSDEKTEYYRFNAPTDAQEFNLDDWQQMECLKVLTQKYLDKPATIEKIEKCARCLVGRRPAKSNPSRRPQEVTANGAE